MNSKYDVTIVGSGPAGTIAALMMARAGRKVALVDRIKTSPRKIGEALPAAARPLLKHLELLPLLESGRHAPSFGHRSAWGSTRLEYFDFINDPNGLGWNLDRAYFDRDLIEATHRAGVEWIEGHVADLMDNGNGWRIEGSGFELESQWLIDATGRRSYIAAKLGVHRLRDDDLTAAYAWFKPLDPTDDPRMLVESSADGWWYSARLPDGSVAAAFHTDSKTAGTIARSPALWNKLLATTHHTRGVLAGALNLGTLQFGEACGARLNKFGGKNWLATGDAALSFDPLSSQGIFNAIYTGMKSAQAVLSGDVIHYCDQLEQIRATYLSNNQNIYMSEQRWPERPFWRRRIQNRAVS